MKKLIVIAGPTASGKTKIAVKLAKQFSCPIISADSRQFYREMTIGTAKPSSEETEGVYHYFIDSHSVENPLSAGQFEKETLKVIEKEFLAHDKLILVGGSGMFIDAVVFGTDEIPHSEEIRKKWNEIFEEKGLNYLQERLKTEDPEYFAGMDQKNPVRLIRALEAIELTGRKFSELRKSCKKSRPFKSHYFVLNPPRETLYDRINTRVDKMIKNGLVEEVKSLTPYKSLQTLNTVGYKEIFEYLEERTDFDEATRLIKQNSRRYAKRQITWFKRNKSAKWIDSSNLNQALEEIRASLLTD